MGCASRFRKYACKIEQNMQPRLFAVKFVTKFHYILAVCTLSFRSQNMRKIRNYEENAKLSGKYEYINNNIYNVIEQ